MISGSLAIKGGPKYEYNSDGNKVIVTCYAYGALQNSAILDKSNPTKTLYTGSSVGEFQAVANLDISGSIFTLKYDVEFFGQSSSSHSKGIIGSWDTND